MIRILLVDDHTLFRQALAFVLEQEPDFTVVAQAGSLGEARHTLQGVDVALIDLTRPDGYGVDLVGALRAANPQGKILILTASKDPSEYTRAVAAGAAGVRHKSVDVPTIITDVRRLS